MKARLPQESSAHCRPQRRLRVKEMLPDRESDNGRDVTLQPATRDMEPISPGQKRRRCADVCVIITPIYLCMCVSSLRDQCLRADILSPASF